MNNVGDIDYRPLEIERHAFPIILKRYRVHTVVIVVIALAVGYIQPIAGLAIVMLWVMALVTRVKILKTILWEDFALANGWQINAVAEPYTLIPLSLQYGYDQNFSSAITVLLGNASADFVEYWTVIGGGKSRQELHFTIARVILPESLPHILLRAKKNKSELGKDFDELEALQLEGDFNDYFTLQVEKGQEVNVLEVLTPDIMQTLVSYDRHEDIEIIGNNLYFIVSGDARNAAGIRQLVESVASLSGQIIAYVQQTTAYPQ